MEQPLISIVVPVYNTEKYLDECVKSILAQSYTNWELILVDDGSTDTSLELCESWQSKDARIRVSHKENGGVSSARNVGIDKSRGEYLAFVDADDWVEPEYLQVLYQTLGQTDLAICCVFDESDWNEKVKEEVVDLQKLRTTPSQYANPVYTNYPCNKLFLTKLIQQHRILFPEDVRRCEDAYFVQDYLLHCKTISVSREKLYHYVQRDGSAMHSFYSGVCKDEIPLMQRQYDFFHLQGLAEKEETSYKLWEWGKVLAIIRYIANYSPSLIVGYRYVDELLYSSEVRERICQEGKQGGRLYSILLRNRQYFILLLLLKYFK